MKKLFFAMLMVLVLAACSNSRVDVLGEWKLVSYGDAANPTPSLADVDTSIEFDPNGQMIGNVGCNGFGGGYEIKDGKITFNGIMSTMMFCDEISAQEEGVLSVFADKVQLKIQMKGDTLTITSADGASVVNLVRK
jgi:heat shock protein HslJ